MSYSANLSEEVINSQFLAVIKPRQRVLSTAFSLYSGSVYRASFTLGPVVAVSVGATALTAGTSVSLSAGQFYYDSPYLYVRKSDSSNPGTSDYIIATYEIYTGTFDSHWYRVPTDDTSTQVYFDPRIIKSPVITQSMSDALFGYFPTKSTSIELANADHFFEGVLGDASFNKVQIKMWHLLGEETTANFRLVFSGSMSTVNYSQDKVSIQILDQADVFDQEYRYSSGNSFFNTSDFASLDPHNVSHPIRQVYGVVDGFVPVNIDYNYDAPTTSNNRIWVVKKGQSNLGSASSVILSGSSTTVTNVTSAQGFRVGDSVWLDRVAGADQYVILTAVDYGANTITHAAIGGGAMAAGDTAKRSFVGRLNIASEEVKYELMYGRDYTESTALANGCSGFTLTNNFEASVGMPAALRPDDIIFCRVYGDKNTETVGGAGFGSNDSKTGNLAQAVVILYKLMKTDLGLAENDINTASFQTLQASNTDTIGFSVMAEAEESFGTYKEIITSILQSTLLRLGKDNDDKWSLTQTGPLGSVTKTIEDDEIVRESISYAFDYNEIVSEVVVEYNRREKDERTNLPAGGIVSSVSATSSQALYLHSQKRSYAVNSLHFDSTQATTLGQRYLYALGDRRGTLRIEAKNRFFDTLLGDVIRISREKIPGFEYVLGTSRTKDFVVTEVIKSLNAVSLTLDDQKGIEDNSASW